MFIQKRKPTVLFAETNLSLTAFTFNLLCLCDSKHSYQGQPLGWEDSEARECALTAGNISSEVAD